MKRLCLITVAVLLTLPIGSAGHASESEWDALNRKAAELYQQGKTDQAIETAIEALAKAQEEFGEDHANVAKTLNNLGVLYSGNKDYKKAEEFYRETLRIETKRMGDASEEVANTYYNLGRLYYQEGKYAKAEESFRRVLEITEKLFGENHPRSAMALGNLMNLYLEMGLQQEAEASYARIQTIREKNL